MEVWGKDVPLPITNASRHGIATIHQDLGLIDSLSIVENVVQTTGFGVENGRPISWRQQRKRVGGLLERLGIRLDPGTEIASLTRGNGHWWQWPERSASSRLAWWTTRRRKGVTC